MGGALGFQPSPLALFVGLALSFGSGRDLGLPFLFGFALLPRDLFGFRQCLFVLAELGLERRERLRFGTGFHATEKALPQLNGRPLLLRARAQILFILEARDGRVDIALDLRAGVRADGVCIVDAIDGSRCVGARENAVPVLGREARSGA